MSTADSNADTWQNATVREALALSADTMLIRLAHEAAEGAADFAPGAHLAVQCGDGITRHYSLTGEGANPGVYEIGVKLAPDSRGGSQWMFANAQPGAQLKISAPRNHFPLVQGASRYLFLSGGIGVTPLLAMLFELRRQGVKARMVHMCRSPEDLPFKQWLDDLANFHDIHVHVDSEAGDVYDLHGELERASPEAEVYCCGPSGMMKVVQMYGIQAGRDERYHFEFFAAPDVCAQVGVDAEFTVIQASTGCEIPVPKTKTMLAAIRDAGIPMKSECEYGVCGWCAVGVVDGTPLHFDSYLTTSEKEANKLVLPCVSRCGSATITLDI